MEPALAAKHPEIKTYSGRGLDNPASTVRFDLTPLGFHASVRGPQGSWYIDPQAVRDTSVYRSFFGRDVVDNPHGRLVERDGEVAEISTDRGYYQPATLVSLKGAGFAPLAPIVVTVIGNDSAFAPRLVDAVADAAGAFEVSFVADPDGNLGAHLVEATDGASTATAAYDVVTDDDTSHDPPVGDQLRTYRVALVTDPSYATLLRRRKRTAAKVTLMNRVTQVYEDETAIRLVLINDTDRTNLDTRGAGHRAQRAVRRLGLLHAGPARRMRRRHAQPQPDRARPARRREQLRRRPPRPRRQRRRRGGPRRRRRRRQGPWLHRPAHPGRRLLRRRLRRARDGPPVRRQPHLQRHPAATARAATAAPPTRSSRAADRPSWRTPASAGRTTCSRTATRTGRSAATPRSRRTSRRAARRSTRCRRSRCADFDTDGDSFTIGFNGSDSAPIVRGTNYTLADIKAAIEAIARPARPSPWRRSAAAAR